MYVSLLLFSHDKLWSGYSREGKFSLLILLFSICLLICKTVFQMYHFFLEIQYPWYFFLFFNQQLVPVHCNSVHTKYCQEKLCSCSLHFMFVSHIIEF